MGKKADLSGIRACGSNRIQFDFVFANVRYRPSLQRIPNEGNMRRAYQQLKDIKRRIECGEFDFSDEFPDFHFNIRSLNNNDPEKCSKTHCR